MGLLDEWLTAAGNTPTLHVGGRRRQALTAAVSSVAAQH